MDGQTYKVSGKSLAELYTAVSERYAEAFAEEFGKSGWFDSSYEIWITEYEAWSIGDIRYVIDNLDELKKRHADLGAELDAWVEYCMACIEFRVKYINLPSWLKGAPRMPSEAIDRLRDLKEEFEKAVMEEQEQWGRMKSTDVPQHIVDKYEETHEE